MPQTKGPILPVSDYGRISTQEQDQREGRYKPHKNVSRFIRPGEQVVQVKCFDCGAYWEHELRGDIEVPKECR